LSLKPPTSSGALRPKTVTDAIACAAVVAAASSTNAIRAVPRARITFNTQEKAGSGSPLCRASIIRLNGSRLVNAGIKQGYFSAVR
jgi:hypothetical protein